MLHQEQDRKGASKEKTLGTENDQEKGIPDCCRHVINKQSLLCRNSQRERPSPDEQEIKQPNSDKTDTDMKRAAVLWF